jgi:membrane-associated phospholipid phosphatase
MTPNSETTGMHDASRGGPIASAGHNLSVLRSRLRRRRVPSLDPRAYHYARLLLAGGALTVVLIVFSLLALDQHAPGWAENLADPARGFFRFMTDFGKSEWLLVPSGVFGLALLCANWNRASREVAAAWVELGELVGFFFFTVAGAGIATDIVKWILGRSRPVRFAKDGILGFHPISFDYAHVSFPSGHATTVAAALTASALIFRRRPVLVGVVALLAVIISVSRVAVRAHYPSDVIGGVFVGVAFTVGYAYALGRNGVGFQRQPDGTLLPKTVAVRLVFSRIGIRPMASGLWVAWFGGGSASGGTKPAKR